MLLFFAALASSGGAPVPVPGTPAAEAPALTLVGPSYRRTSPVLTGPVQDALLDRDWRGVVDALHKGTDHLDVTGRQEAAFLEAWALVRLDQAEKAAPLLPKIDGGVTIPAPYRDLVIGEVKLASGDKLGALEALSLVPADAAIYPRAAVLRAETLKELGRTAEAFEVFEAIASRPDPANGNPLALLALAYHKGAGSPEAYPYLRRLWTHYPTSAEATEANRLLGKYTGAAYAPTPEEWSIRAEKWMYARDYGNAILAAQNVPATKDVPAEALCRALYVKGRSEYKKNQLSASIAAFGDAGTRCVGVPGEYGARSLYLVGTAQFRKKQYAESAASFAQIPGAYPEHSMADDGYTHAGISMQEGGDLAAAQGYWKKALEDHPDGDTAAEATFRLAWSLYLDGKTDEARGIAKRLGALDVSVDAEHVDAGRYWHARWALYPDVGSPSKPHEAGKAEAVAGWSALLRERPFSFYAILAAARLKEVAPDVLAELQKRPEREPLERPWAVRQELLDHPGIQHGAALARLGLAIEARAEWERWEGELLPDEKAWLTELRILSGDWLLAHEDFRGWIREHPVGSLGEGERAVIRVAYPDRYWAEVQKSAKPYSRYEPRLFHSLVREESNFNRRIVSFAGARGLSQLMPATATQTAGWLGKKVTMTELFEPDKNLEIGARYLEQVFKQLDDSPFCALAGYNAGPARVTQWKGEWGNVPTDEFVERIPFRETRGYVKRVMGTWQTYRWFIDDGQPFPELDRLNHRMQPGG
ncbi:MAG: transglycosylase SLT domain-containing protein [Alphaproteobacteria bacterium]|nr:transglycosylase SLT domain-containing protein [Alphaproteobacteria bacterium]